MTHFGNPYKLLRGGALVASLLFSLSGCGNGSAAKGAENGSGKAELLSVDMGRLVDVYAYQRIDPALGDRRLRTNRQLVRIATNVVVNPRLGNDSLFNAAGEEIPTATYELRPFDSSIGHEELVILWDNRPGPEASRFSDALAAAQQGLLTLAPAFRGQNVVLRPIPIAPRNAALRLQFSGPIQATEELLRNNPAVVQLLEFKGDPAVVSPADAFRILPCRVIPQGDRIIVDTTILGGEGESGVRSNGLPPSDDNVTANIRLAIPTRGSALSSIFVKADGIADLNGVDSSGRAAVIRDFRSGNLLDGAAGRLPEDEAPMIVGSFSMGITSIDTSSRVLTLTKRGNLVPVRGRYPFVDGPLGPGGVPMGPLAAPIATPLRSGDILTQTRLVEMPNGTFEPVVLRAEILENLEIGTEFGGSLPLGRSGSSNPAEIQGQHLTSVRVRVASLAAGVDSLGRPQSFQAIGTSQGSDCILRAYYYDSIAFTGSTQAMGDRAWRKLFLRVDPQPTANPGSTAITDVNPIGSFAVEFSKPMDLDQVDPTVSLVLTNTAAPMLNPENPAPGEERFAAQMDDPKKATARLVSSRLSDLNGDGTILRLQAPYGLYHQSGATEPYAFHVKLGTSGVTDLAGNPVRLYDSATSPLEAWSVNLVMSAAAATNRIGFHTYNFTDADEDGSLPGSTDIFGQFRLQGGRLFGATGVRFSRTADNQNLGAISRISRGECWDTVTSLQGVPTTQTAPSDDAGAPHPGRLYWQPKMLDSIAPPAVPQVYEYWQQLPQKVGRVLEPHSPRGSRMQMRYIEDDFTLDYREPAEFALDVEQLYWSPFDDESIYYDVFDRYSMSLAHSNKRTDLHFVVIPGSLGPPLVPPGCQYVCLPHNSALSTVFADNVLQGTTAVSVVEDKIYRINPNEAFRSSLGVKYVPYPRFDRSYTWRDSRLVTVDSAGQVIGLGGAQSPGGTQPNAASDWTANIDSPWVTSAAPAPFLSQGFSTWVMDDADFKGNVFHDHDPIALPLLVDFKVFPDTPANNGLANGQNSFQVALVGPPTYGFPAAPGGYYDRRAAGCPNTMPRWPDVRAQASGGEDLITGAPIYIDPANQLVAQPSTLRDAGLGNATRALFQAPARDGMLNWARADFVRKVSTATFGFVDTLQPQRALFVEYAPSGAASVTASNGFPDLLAVDPNLRISDIVVQMDPPLIRQPAGTSVVVEIRGAESFANSGVLYNPDFNQASQVADDAYGTRGNLLNPNYACEAYRYSQASFGAGFNTPRVAATGLTRYVTDDQINLIRDPATQLLPRFLNLRLNMTNNVNVTPPLSPSLRSLSIVYRLRAP